MFKKKKDIRDLKAGDFVDDVFVVKIKREMRKYTNGYRFALILSDASGESVEYVYWGETNREAVKKIYDKIHEDSVVHIQGGAGTYRNKLQISANAGDTVEVIGEGDYDPHDFIEASARPVDEMIDELRLMVDSVKDTHLSQLLKQALLKPSMIPQLKVHPSAIGIHHARLGGFLEHNLEVAKIAELYAKLFNLSRDLVIAGALLHDIGKLDEMQVTTRIKGTRQGQLLGHTAQGAIKISKLMDELDFPELLRDKVLHIIVSHHGHLEYGAAREPMFPEALAVFLADLSSSRLDEMKSFIDSVGSRTEDDFVFYKRNAANWFTK